MNLGSYLPLNKKTAIHCKLMNRNKRDWAVIAAISFVSVVAAQDSSEEVVEIEEFIVTGSLLPTTETAYEARAVPIQVIEREVFDAAGFVTVEEFLQKLPINNGGSIPMQNNQVGFTPGASSASLRGLGPDSTLILINGKRLAPWPTGAGGTTAFIDLNSIPAAAIKRVEVLKEGASATYGADAVAGGDQYHHQFGLRRCRVGYPLRQRLQQHGLV